MRKMKAQLPIPVRATSKLARLLKPGGVKLGRGQELFIKNLFYMGDAGGISCDVTPPETSPAIVCSLTQIEINSDHPLAEEIRDYQQARKRRLSRANRGADAAFIEPSEKSNPRKRKRAGRRNRRR